MKLFLPKEMTPGETRVSMVPDGVRKLVELGAEVEIESGLGDAINQPDDAYTHAGAAMTTHRGSALGKADMVLCLRPLDDSEMVTLKAGAILVSYLDPFFNLDRVQKLADANVSAICMEMIPRTTIAQKMDALSSQANLAGYVAVLIASNKLERILPMMMTPAGTLSPAKVFIIGAGVAGL